MKTDPGRREIFLKVRREDAKAKYAKYKQNPEFLKRKREQMKMSRWRKKNVPSEDLSLEEEDFKPFKVKSTLSKAVNKVLQVLPKEDDKKKAVIKKLYSDQYCEKKPKYDKILPPRREFQLVTDFFLRDDISQQLPGMNDTKLIRNPDHTKTRIQKRVMMFTLSEAFAEFRKLNPEADVGRTKFCSLKPAYVEHVDQMKQIGCLCKMCENLKLLFSSLQPRMNEAINSLSDMMEKFSCYNKFCDGVSCEVCSENYINLIPELFEHDELTDEITVSQWVQDVYQLKIKNEIKDLSECINLLLQKIIDYKEHIFIKQSQSSLFYDKRALSNDKNIVIQIDFAENFKCLAQNEVQSAYFNQHGIAIFTVVVWAGDQTYSQCYVSDDTSHSKYCVLAFLNEIISGMKSKLPDLKSIEIFSDGCAAQFKNRWILSLVLTAEHLFGVNLTWNFFASGHGKGAVDGIGGTVKRAVHQRIMSGNVKVYSAEEFNSCVNNSMKGISSTYVSVEDIKMLEQHLAPLWKKNVKAIPGLTKYFTYKKHSEKSIEALIVGSSNSGKIFKLLN